MHKSMQNRKFTIIEILVVIAVIIILAAMLIPVIKVITQKASRAQTQEQMQTIMEALEQYKEHYGYYPITTPLILQQGDSGNQTNYYKGTTILLQESFLDDNMRGLPKFSGVDPSDAIWKDKYGASATDGVYLVDPYDEPYYYTCPGKMNRESYDLWSTGPDLEHGDKGGMGLSNEKSALRRDENDDVTNWKNDFK